MWLHGDGLIIICVLSAVSAKESLSSAALPATPSTPVTSYTPVLTSAPEAVVSATKPGVDVQDTAGDLHGNLLRTITQLMQQQQQQPPQNQATQFILFRCWKTVQLLIV